VVKICGGDFMFRVVDKQTRTDLVFGANPVYLKDSVFLEFRPGTGSISSSISGKFMSNALAPYDTLYLHLSPTDYDTLVLTFHYKRSKCCDMPNGYGTVTSIQFNGTPAPFEEGSYLLLK
jgi:hypothetical protein